MEPEPAPKVKEGVSLPGSGPSWLIMLQIMSSNEFSWESPFLEFAPTRNARSNAGATLSFTFQKVLEDRNAPQNHVHMLELVMQCKKILKQPKVKVESLYQYSPRSNLPNRNHLFFFIMAMVITFSIG